MQNAWTRPRRGFPVAARSLRCAWGPFLCLLILSAAAPSRAEPPAASAPVHPSPIAGSWYPADPAELRQTIRTLLSDVSPAPPPGSAPLVGLIVPHAAYVYSGQTAAAGYALLARRRPARVILLGPSHHGAFHGLSLGDYAAYETPLGRVPVDPEARALLAHCPLISFHPQAHRREHALDIQLPFLQVLFDPPPRIVPLLVGQLRPEDYAPLTACLARLLDDETVVVVSSDFTHYGPRFAYLPFAHDDFTASKLEILDGGACQEILQLDAAGFLAYRKKSGITICGYQPIALLLHLLPPGTRAERIAYETSGRLTGDYRDSVSYATLAFFNPSRWGRRPRAPGERTDERQAMSPADPSAPPPSSASPAWTAAERSALLRLATDTLQAYVTERRRPDPDAPSYAVTPRLREERGAFVTLKKHGELRGCIGYILPVAPLLQTVQENTVNACSRDTRFPPVRPEELADIHLEISVLSVPRPVASPEDIEIGRHGIVLKNGSRRAVFLPQVATEQGWGREETLRHLARKAGLPAGAWNDPDTVYEVFTAHIIEQDAHP